MHFSRGEQIVIALSLLILLLAGAVWLYLAGARADRYEEEALLTPPPVAPVEPEKKVLVHICGQVRRPGVYRVKPDNRVLEVIKFAGGPTRQADIHALNLAAVVEDGSRIYVPSKAETRPAVARAEQPLLPASGSARLPAPTSPVPAPPPSPGLPDKININTATAAQLELLPRIGPAIARRIIEHRQKNGFFGKPEDLMAVPGIGEKTFAQIQPYLTVAPP